MELAIENKVVKGQPVNLFPLNEYDYFLISESGGKDSIVCLWHLLDLGIDPAKIQLWHQSIDGGTSGPEFLDWPVTESYVDAVGQLYGIKTSYQWRENGIYGELLRKDSLTGNVYYLDGGKIVCLPTRNGKKSTRYKWPAKSPDLSRRWCSAYVKIDVFRRVLNNHPDFRGSIENPVKILVISGERRQESPNRAKYLESEIHACNTRSRIVHAWRPVIDWPEERLWEEYERRRFLPHPAYLLGWNRTSCFGCIFSTPDLWAMMREIAPERFDVLVNMEKYLEHRVDNKLTLVEMAERGSLKRLPKSARTNKWVKMALSRNFNDFDLIVDKWELPAGALLGAAGGPV